MEQVGLVVLVVLVLQVGLVEQVGLVVHMLGYFRTQGIGEECTKTQDQTVTAKSLGCHWQNSRFLKNLMSTFFLILGSV